jgi:acetate---CoA ligase (ADP-forming)
VALKAGRTGDGRRAASSHTATMEAGELVVEALFHQAVVIRAGTLEEMSDIVAVVSSQPAPAGTAGRGADQRRRPGHLVAEACEAAGLPAR